MSPMKQTFNGEMAAEDASAAKRAKETWDRLVRTLETHRYAQSKPETANAILDRIWPEPCTNNP